MTNRRYDAIVYGATPAGIMTAVAVAREGKSVLLIEPGRFIGGMVAGGLSRTDYGNEKTVGGYAREYFDRCSAEYGGEARWYLEPHVFEQVFEAMIRENGRIELLREQRLQAADMDGNRLVAVRLANGGIYEASVFADCTYEGDLMAKAGVPYRVGRESAAMYGEPLAGVQMVNKRNMHRELPLDDSFMGSECACLGGAAGKHYVSMSAFAQARDGYERLRWGVNPLPAQPDGSGDGKTQAYNFRLTVTRHKDNQVPFPKPRHYDPDRYELLLDYILRWPMIRFARLVHLGKLANDKFDVNNNGPFSTDYVGGNTAYPDGDYAAREAIWQDHIDYVQGFFWFLGHDPRVPERLRNEVAEWGLCKDEFVRNGNWPYQLYVREGRRMRGAYVMTQHDLLEQVRKTDAVAIGCFVIDSHSVDRVVNADGFAVNEGGIDVHPQPYHIPFSCLVPRKDDAVNLLVPICLSASHVAYGSLRMEPVYMMLGHAAGIAASMLIESGPNGAIQDIDIGRLQRHLQRQGLSTDLQAI